MINWTSRLGAYVICIRDEQVLLVRMTSAAGAREWTLPGGGVEPGEDPYDAAIRECAEESGYTVAIDNLLGIDSVVLRQGNSRRKSDLWHGIRIIYTGRITGGELRDEIGGSTDATRWIPLAEVPSLPTVALVDAGLRFYRERPADGHNGTT